MLVVQTVYIAIERNPVKRYNDGLLAAPACLLLAASVCVRLVVLLFYTSHPQSYNALMLVDTLEILAALGSLIACLSIRRRPSVSEGNHVVDGQYTVSAFSSYTFGFAGKILSLARNKKSLDLVDLPQLHLWGRSAYLLHRFGGMTTKTDRLWKSVIFTHWPELIFQTGWAIIQSILQFAPQLAMYQLLKLLEQRSQGAAVNQKAWGLVVALGASIILASVSVEPKLFDFHYSRVESQKTCLRNVLLLRHAL